MDEKNEKKLKKAVFVELDKDPAGFYLGVGKDLQYLFAGLAEADIVYYTKYSHLQFRHIYVNDLFLGKFKKKEDYESVDALVRQVVKLSKNYTNFKFNEVSERGKYYASVKIEDSDNLNEEIENFEKFLKNCVNYAFLIVVDSGKFNNAMKKYLSYKKIEEDAKLRSFSYGFY